MNKTDLIDAVVASTGISKSDGANAIDSMLNAISGALKDGDEVRLTGFGTFCVAQRKASEGRNPRTGEVIQIPASKLPKFKPGKALKQAMN
jgi:DNA-binding protein HU-beta